MAFVKIPEITAGRWEGVYGPKTEQIGNVGQQIQPKSHSQSVDNLQRESSAGTELQTHMIS